MADPHPAWDRIEPEAQELARHLDILPGEHAIELSKAISLKRLDARPIATLSIEAQERHERRERVYRDD